MYTPKRPTLVQIAKLAGVSHVTVSLALRGSLRISEMTRNRIKKIALKVGYQPDPMLSALINYRKLSQPRVYQATLGWINLHPKREIDFHDWYMEGASHRARELGYLLEEFRLDDYEMRLESLSKVLRARNISGIILSTHPRGRAHLRMDWENFSAVKLGYSVVSPPLHVVTTAQYQCGVTAMRSLRALGYRRIGCVLSRNYDERTDHNFSASFLREQCRSERLDAVPLFLYDGKTLTQAEKLFARWYRKYQPQAILTFYCEVPMWLERMGIKKAACPVVLININTKDTRWAGVSQNEYRVGWVAVDTLVNLLYRNERGIPDIPLRILVEGRWKNAGLLPRAAISQAQLKGRAERMTENES